MIFQNCVVKKILLICALFIFNVAAYAQQLPPSYIDIIKTFCEKYNPFEENDNYTAFAKKKAGWYVIQVNRLQADRLLSEKLFFSLSTNKYLDLSSDYSKPINPDVEKQLAKYLVKDGSTADWYGFERIAYYGYNGWFVDMITDFANSKTLSDVMHDGLGRSYVGMENSYLWYQQGGMYPEYDTLHRKLGRLELPSARRIDSVKQAIDNALVEFGKLKSANPQYKTAVGNSTLKLFNEYIHGYSLMSICNKEDLARQYLDKAYLPESYITQAKNYLNSCGQNAILFSYGDNDTYQLWYVQEKYNFRKDVLVINNSLLGLPTYIEMYKRKQLVTVTIPDSYIESMGSELAYYIENEDYSDNEVSLKEFLASIYKFEFPYESEGSILYPTYPYQNISMDIPVSWNSISTSLAPEKIHLKINDPYLYGNDIAMLDIIVNNINKRPVYFTTSNIPLFENHLVQSGIIYKLIAGDANADFEKNTEVKFLEKFYNERYIPILSNDSDFISLDGDNCFFAIFYKILNHYLEKGDLAGVKTWLRKMERNCPIFNSTQINTAKSLAYYYIEAGENQKGLEIINQYTKWLNDVYLNPSSLTGYFSEEKYKDELTKTKEYLELRKLRSPIVNKLLKR